VKLRFKKDRFNFLLPQILEFINSIKEDIEYVLEIKQYRKPRSLNANNLSWKLTDELADVLVLRGAKITKEECHAELIFRYGQVMLDENGEQVVYSTSSGVSLPEFYPYAKAIGESELNGKTFTHYRIYRPSHTYDSWEFSVFLTGIIEECKEQGIEVMTPELKSLLEDN
jgi:hypothetical protein